MTDWQDKIVGARMTVDGEFAGRIDDSRFSRQEWGLIMTATEFEIENPEDETAAKLVADTDDLRGMMPEIERVANMGPMGNTENDGDDGFFGSIGDALGLGGSDPESIDEEKLHAAEDLVAAYAERLQAHLESEGRWEEIRTTAAEQREA
jgi:hypothetical protein